MEFPIKQVRCINCNKNFGSDTTLTKIFSVASTADIKEGLQHKCDRCGVINTIYPMTLDKNS